MALDADFASASYNAYIDLAEADIRIAAFSPFVNTAKWDALLDPDKENLIIIASGDVGKFLYIGVISSSIISQHNMQWPRTDANYVNGVAIPPTANPEFIQSYVSQRCLEILNYGADEANKSTKNKNIKSKKVDVIKTEFFSNKEVLNSELSVEDFVSYSEISPYVVGQVNKKSNSYFLVRA